MDIDSRFILDDYKQSQNIEKVKEMLHNTVSSYFSTNNRIVESSIANISSNT